MPKTLRSIAEELGGTVQGDGDHVVLGICGIDEAGAGDLSFVADARYRDRARSSGAGALVVPRGSGPWERPTIEVDDVEIAVERLAELFAPPRPVPSGKVEPGAHLASSARLGAGVTVLPGACVMEEAEIGDGTVISCGVYVGRGTRVGQGCELHPNVVVHDRVRLGDRVIVHAGSVLGADGFGFRPTATGLQKLRHVGTVEVGDDVEIGACVTIDRARLGATRIGAGTKIDNLVQIAHNVRIGRHCIIVAQTGISGSTVIGDGCVIGGQAGFVGHVRVGSGARIAARAGISKDVPAGATVYGYVAGDHAARKREEAAVRRLPELVRKVRALEARVRAFEAPSGPEGP